MTHTRRVLVTGARGFIGATLLDAARRAAVPDLELVGVDYEDADLRDPVATARLIRDIRPERVVHLAAKLVRGEGAEVLREQREHTFNAGTVLIDAALEAGVGHVLVPGTVDEFGGREGVLAADDATQPLSYYGLCKSWLREYASFHARRGALRVDWFRLFTVYGPRQTLGSMLLPTAFRAAKSGRHAQFTEGLQERDFIHVDDVVTWLLRALSIPLARRGFWVHHLGTGQPVTVRAVLQAIAEEFPGAEFELGALPRRVGEPNIQISAPFASEEPALHDWRPRYGWREGIKQTADWWKAQDEV